MVRSARSEMERLAAAAIDHVGFLQEAHAILRRAIGFDVSPFATSDPATVLLTCCIIPDSVTTPMGKW